MCHAILHRIEGDYENSRLWYQDVARDSAGLELLQKAWGDENAGDKAGAFVNEVQALKEKKQGDRKDLEKRSLAEIMTVVKACEEKFGSGKWEDASAAWTKSPEKNQKMKEAMTTGAEGHRKF